MKKLGKMPIEVDALLASPRWLGMEDYQRCWYLTILFRMWMSLRPGYVPNDGQLWRLAGARTENFFKQKSSVVLACFEIRSIDGCSWIFSAKVETLHRTASEKYETKADNARKSVRKRSVPEVYVSVSALPVTHIYEAYPRKVKPLKAKESIRKAIQKKAESSKISELDASQLILVAVQEYAASPVGKSKFALHPTTWFNQGCYDDDRTEWYRDETNGKPTAKKSNLDKVFGTDSEGMDGCDGGEAVGEPATRFHLGTNGDQGKIDCATGADRRAAIHADDEPRYHGMSLLHAAVERD